MKCLPWLCVLSILTSTNSWAAALQQADVIVVGGGLSGLAAARKLVEANQSVIVLEARDRVGGRTWTKIDVPGGGWIDMGGQFIGPTQDRILALAEAVGVTRFPTYHQGNDVFIFQGKKMVGPAGSVSIPEKDMQELAAALVKYFGEEAAHPTAFYIANWPNETWSRGCYSGQMPPGVWTGYPNALRDPVDRIHWAGTETSTVWWGYMDGAVRAGERAADEIIASSK